MAARLSGPISSRRRAALLAIALLAAVVASGCMNAAGLASPAPLATPSPPPDAAILATRGQVEATLRAAGFGLVDVTAPYRPPETAALAAAPRGVYRVVLPNDPDHGVVVIYDLVAPAPATDAARAYASYLAGGPVRVEFPPDTRVVLRQAGSTLIFYTWSAANSPDASGGRVADVLETLGQGFEVR